jgi:hypothetical protein
VCIEAITKAGYRLFLRRSLLLPNGRLQGQNRRSRKPRNFLWGAWPVRNILMPGAIIKSPSWSSTSGREALAYKSLSARAVNTSTAPSIIIPFVKPSRNSRTAHSQQTRARITLPHSHCHVSTETRVKKNQLGHRKTPEKAQASFGRIARV